MINQTPYSHIPDSPYQQYGWCATFSRLPPQDRFYGWIQGPALGFQVWDSMRKLPKNAGFWKIYSLPV